MLFSSTEEFFQPIWLRESIGIEEDKPFSARKSHANVIGGGKAMVFFECNSSNFQIGIMFVNVVVKAIRRAVIYNDNLEVLDGLSTQAG